MKTKRIKLRFRRGLRKSQKQVGDIGTQAEQQIERHLFRRFDRLMAVRRFVVVWSGLLILLIALVVGQNIALSGYYQTERKVPGGIYNEGVHGRFTNSSPLYATTDADATVSKLLFAGLFTYDQKGRLVGDLAESYTADASGMTYTVKLKPNLKWHDGRPLTSADVVFTYQLIQNPDVQSPLQSAYQGVQVTAPDASTVVFKLPGGLAAFAYGLNNGIVPRHILEKVPPAAMRSVDFNTVKPVGAGPFKWQAIQVSGDGNPRQTQQQIAMEPFKDYQGGKPKLQKFVTHVYADENQLIEAFTDRRLTAVEGLGKTPPDMQDKPEVIKYTLPLRAATMVFFKTSSGVLTEAPVRQALVQAADVPRIANGLGYQTRLVRQPFLAGQLGYDPSLNQAGFDLKAANQLLDSSGWIKGKDGIRAKDGKSLTFGLTAADTPDHRNVAGNLKRQWQRLGVKLDAQFLDAGDFQNALDSHDYDSILYGISIGPDPDVFVYWDSSQSDIRSANRLNLSEYNNPAADAALEAGRTRLDPALRFIKYRPFLEAWQKDNPALGLYQPRVLYLANVSVGGLNEQAINTPADRFNNVHNWQIREAKVTNP